MKKYLLPFLILLLFFGCTKIDYIGEEYAPTSYVDIYYDDSEIAAKYKVMGELIATGDEWVSSEKMLKDIKKKAMEKGADGVIIVGFDKYFSGETTKYTEETKETSKGSKTTATTSTSSEEQKEIKARFIKYL